MKKINVIVHILNHIKKSLTDDDESDIIKL